MFSEQLNLFNLNNRPYVHGTSIVKGVFDSLNAKFLNISDFEIRLKKKLTSQPILNVFEKEYKNENAVSVGQFKCSNNKYYFNLLPSKHLCSNVVNIDESRLEKRILCTEKDWSMNIDPADDLHVCLNTLSKFSNRVLFKLQSDIVIVDSKQTWFVGYKLPKINFFYEPCFKISMPKEYEMVNKICMKRQFFINDIYAGERFTIYA